MILGIEANFSCDECGTVFTVDIDPGRSQVADWSAMELAEDAIRGGGNYRDDNGDPIDTGCGSVDGERHLCARCTRASDTEAK